MPKDWDVACDRAVLRRVEKPISVIDRDPDWDRLMLVRAENTSVEFFEGNAVVDRWVLDVCVDSSSVRDILDGGTELDWRELGNTDGSAADKIEVRWSAREDVLVLPDLVADNKLEDDEPL